MDRVGVKVDWPAASHVLIKRLTARTMLMFRNDLVSTWDQLSRDLFSPSPKVHRRNNKRLISKPRLDFLIVRYSRPRQGYVLTNH